MIIYLLAFVYLLLWGFVSIHGRVSKLGIGEKPLMYESVFIQGILNIFFMLFLISTIVLLIYSWKLALFLFAIGMVTSRIIFDPLIERLFFLPIVAYLTKKGREIGEKENKMNK